MVCSLTRTLLADVINGNGIENPYVIHLLDLGISITDSLLKCGLDGIEAEPIGLQPSIKHIFSDISEEPSPCKILEKNTEITPSVTERSEVVENTQPALSNFRETADSEEEESDISLVDVDHIDKDSMEENSVDHIDKNSMEENSVESLNLDQINIDSMEMNKLHIALDIDQSGTDDLNLDPPHIAEDVEQASAEILNLDNIQTTANTELKHLNVVADVTTDTCKHRASDVVGGVAEFTEVVDGTPCAVGDAERLKNEKVLEELQDNEYEFSQQLKSHKLQMESTMLEDICDTVRNQNEMTMEEPSAVLADDHHEEMVEDGHRQQKLEGEIGDFNSGVSNSNFDGDKNESQEYTIDQSNSHQLR